MRDGSSTEGNLPAWPWADHPTEGSGVQVVELADCYFCSAPNIRSIEVWERSWLGLGPFAWRCWFKRRDA
jgi:hypothetical protein